MFDRDKIYTFQPEKVRDAPNFEKIHKAFRKKLVASKKVKKNVKPEPFDLS